MRYAIIFMSLLLSGCSNEARTEWEKPADPVQYRACKPLTDAERTWCDKTPAAREICRKADHNAIRCDQLDDWRKMMRRNWPL